MKTFLVLAVCLFSFQVFACNGEAQFIAKVGSKAECRVTLSEISYFSDHFFCPLGVENVKKLGLTLTSEQCQTYDEGMAISGIMFREGDKIFLEY